MSLRLGTATRTSQGHLVLGSRVPGGRVPAVRSCRHGADPLLSRWALPSSSTPRSAPRPAAAAPGRDGSRRLRAAAAAPAAAGGGSSVTTWKLTLVVHVPAKSDVGKLGLELSVIGLDGTATKPVSLRDDKDAMADERLGRAGLRANLADRQVVFDVQLPAGFVPAAVNIRNAKDDFELSERTNERVLLHTLALQPDNAVDDEGRVSFTANSYIIAEQGWRLFVRDDAWTNASLKEEEKERIAKLEDEELQALRGEGKNAGIANEERKPGDRIYRWATYNDLGKDPSKDNGDNVRPTLGGDALYKYPRRLATNRGLYENKYEKPPNTSGILEPLLGDANTLLGTVINGLGGKVLPSPWVPEDDNFSASKSAGFIGNALLGALPNVIDQLGSVFDKNPGKEFDSIAEVLSLYDEDKLGVPQDSEFGLMGGKVANNFRERLGDIDDRDRFFNLVNGRRQAKDAKGKAADRKNYISLVDFAAPRSISCLEAPTGTCDAVRLPTWATDKEFGRMFFGGLNPLVVEAVADEAALERLLPRSGPNATAIASDDTLRALLEGRTLEDWAKEAGAGGKRRLFVVDYWAFYGFLDEVNNGLAATKGKKDDDKVLHAGRAVLFRRADGFVVPVAIELAHKQGEPATVYTASDPGTVWLAAKLIFLSVDSGYHQLVSHFVRTHACTEPYLIAMRRQLSPTHPIFRLMIPHFRYTLAINAGARSLLINAGGVIEQTFTPGEFSMRLSAAVYGLTWRFKDEGLAADLKKRGFPDTAEELAAKVGEYPYAEDGLLVWEALRSYFTEYVGHYYASDADVTNDKRLNNWWKDVRENGHKDITEGWIELQGRESLVDILSTIAWVASAHHAAVNFGQYDYSAWPVTHSSMCRKPAPARGSDAWKELAALDVFSATYQKAAEAKLLRYVAPPEAATKVMATVTLLSAHAEDEQYLSAGPERQEWLPLDQDQTLRAIFDKFVKRMREIDGEVDTRNQDAARLARSPAAGGLQYTLLRPTSETPGVTFKGVPYSISI